MKNTVTYVCFVQDHSGSMQEPTQDKKCLKNELATSNFNEQLAKIKKDEDENTENLVSIIEFDDQINSTYDNVPVSEMKSIKHWWTGGMTALYDAIAFGINTVKSKMDKDTRENKAALVIIQTDGQENSSSDYYGEKGRLKLKKQIEELEATNKWTFIFLGENIDKQVAVRMGMNLNNIMSHKGNSNDIQAAYSVTLDSMDNYFSSRKMGVTCAKNFYNTGKKPDDETYNDNSSKVS